MISVRPAVTELTFHLFERSLHPELFEVFERCVVECEHYTARLEIIDAGHVVNWRMGDVTLAEVITSTRQPLPRMRRLLTCELQGRQNKGLECRGGVRYHTCLQQETTTPKMFRSIQEALLEVGRRRGMLYRFEPVGRISLEALSYINFQPRPSGLLIQTFHTFPADYAVVKTQSLFLLPQGLP